MARWHADRDQQAILDAWSAGSGHLMIDAAPGTGKTRTLAACLGQIDLDHKRVLVASFSRAVRDAWATRVPDHEHLQTLTLHGLGLAALMRSLGTTTLWPTKYEALAHEALLAVAPDQADEVGAVASLVRLLQVTLTSAFDQPALDQVALRYGLDLAQTRRLAPLCARILARGRTIAEQEARISYDDMVYLPSVLPLDLDVYDVVALDEGQDITAAQAYLIKQSLVRGGRALVACDFHQAVYDFAGADPHVLEVFLGTLRAGNPQSLTLPLRICYRCPRSHIALANRIYPVLEPRPQAPDGTVQGVEHEEALWAMRPGDLVLCRTTGPLIALAYKLLTIGQRVRLLGHDLAGPLQNTVALATQQPGADDDDTFERALGDYSIRAQDALAEAGPEGHLASAALWDRVNTVRVIWEHAQPQTVATLRADIQRLCTLDQEHAVTLSTVHRAKGLESERVFILRPDLLPHPRATTDDQKRQEQNLAFVSLTRSTRDLFLVTGPTNAPQQGDTPDV